MKSNFKDVFKCSKGWLECFMKRYNLKILIDNLNNSPGRNVNLNIHLKEKMKNVNILAACGWSYK